MPLGGQLDIRVGFVILEHDIVLRVMLFDQIQLKDERLDVGGRDKVFKVLDFAHEPLRLGIV
ncbi:hypothetical protein C772_02927 [Bhargavaea cecembensis DSE10]|uniref:Uncharacterized protein n=1 Tax=Bhargavaea cecembensis DSE10 TaxID=1235279 RepID=M7NCU1_9BACL|nr:hypothetical protein C772_02927 [Bhargavaea cecembensis DSE10]